MNMGTRILMGLLIAGIFGSGQTPPSPAANPCDPARPKLKRGKPGPADPKCAPEPEAQVPVVIGGEKPAGDPAEPEDRARLIGPPATAPGAPLSDDDPIEKAREAAYEFSQKLPNFICEQLTSRHSSDQRPVNWRYEDRVQAELLYVDGREDYRNLKRNGKPIKKGSPQDTGQWSSGEFGTWLLDIFASNTQAKFTRRTAAMVGTTAVEVYDIAVQQPNSHWKIMYGRTIQPAYKGSVWIDPKTSRVMRLEMRAIKLPDDFEMDVVESTVEYGWVKIGTERYLLPTRSENLSCKRGTFLCSKNEIEFRNYRKFTAESTIGTTESNVSFEEAPKAPASGPAPGTPPPAKKKQ